MDISVLLQILENRIEDFNKQEKLSLKDKGRLEAYLEIYQAFQVNRELQTPTPPPPIQVIEQK